MLSDRLEDHEWRGEVVPSGLGVTRRYDLWRVGDTFPQWGTRNGHAFVTVVPVEGQAAQVYLRMSLNGFTPEQVATLTQMLTEKIRA